MPPNTVKVDRSTPWGNKYRVTTKRRPGDGTAAECVALFRAWREHDAAFRAKVHTHLQGKNLGCWCKPGDPCHAEVLLIWANDEM
jgi:hypothetical protein